MKTIWRYLMSKLAREHLIVSVAAVGWLIAAVWQLWTFGGRPETIVSVFVMGGFAGTIGYYLATVNRVDSDKKDMAREQKARREDRA